MKPTLPALALGLATVFLASDSPGLIAAPQNTGIQGQAFLYFSHGVRIEIEPGFWISPGDVQLPVATAFTILSARNGHEVARVITDVNGLYSVSLRPGAYVLVPDPVSRGPFCAPVSTEPIEVTVRPRQFTPLNIFYSDPPCVIQVVP